MCASTRRDRKRWAAARPYRIALFEAAEKSTATTTVFRAIIAPSSFRFLRQPNHDWTASRRDAASPGHPSETRVPFNARETGRLSHFLQLLGRLSQVCCYRTAQVSRGLFL